MSSKNFNHARKSGYVHHILHDFVVRRTRLLDSDLTHIASDVRHECLLVSIFFQDRHGKLVAASLRNLLSAQHFEGIPSVTDPVSCDDVF